MRSGHVILAIFLVSVTGCADAPTSAAPMKADVFTPGFIFSPFSTVIALGGEVVFHITGDEHNVIFRRPATGGPEDIQVVRDQTVSRTFNTRGTFAYDCTIHPGMAGEVVVK